MHQAHVNDFVRLNHDIPELGLHSGQVGVVCSTWSSPATAYEVEFGQGASATRTLLLPNQIEPDADSH